MRVILYLMLLVLPAFAEINFSKIVPCSNKTVEGYIFAESNNKSNKNLTIKSLTIVGIAEAACSVGAILPNSSQGSEYTVNILLYPDLKHIGPLKLSPKSDQYASFSNEQIRSEVLLNQGTLKDKLAELAKFKDELRRLESDAEIIANVGKIVSVREHLSKVKEATDAIARDNQVLSRVVEEMGKGSTAPRRLKQRVTESTTTLNAMVRLLAAQRAGQVVDNAAIANHIRETMDRLVIAESTNIESLEIELKKQKDVG